MTHRTLAFALVAVVAGSTAASADTKSWTALKNNLPANATLVIGIDVKAARGSTAYTAVVQNVLDASHDVKMGVDAIKQVCSIDVASAVTDVTFAIATKGHKDGIVAIGLDGLDEAKLVDCAGKIMKLQSKTASISSSKDGKATKYVIDDGHDKNTVYASWAAKDVLVVSLDAADRKKLDGYLNGKAASGDLGGYLGNAKTGSLAWMAAAINEDHLKGAFGSVTLAKGSFTGAARFTADSAAEATKAVKEATKSLGEAADHLAKKSPDLAKALRAIKVAATGSDLTIDGSVADGDVAPMFMALLMN